ncbi:hypothetical protein ACFVWP_05090 [Streptomyces sp. NPDC058175]|uniref:hypothetical protein n=1 Tax=Streptomyces sp. NPDC058175 TaxID=3346367 RepID=UPI0036EA651B
MTIGDVDAAPEDPRSVRSNDCRAPAGRRACSARGHTPWTTTQRQDHGAVSAPCPRGRVGTYNYRLAIAVEVAGIKADAPGRERRHPRGLRYGHPPSARADTTDT